MMRDFTIPQLFGFLFLQEKFPRIGGLVEGIQLFRQYGGAPVYQQKVCSSERFKYDPCNFFLFILTEFLST